MREGWYLMNLRDVEKLLAAWRASDLLKDFGVPLTTDEALQIRDAGNVPDARDRSLRLVFFVDDEPLERKRLRFEPDYHSAPSWRRPGSRPVHIVPLRKGAAGDGEGPAWWELPRVGELEEEWRRTGAVAGIPVPAEYRSFVFKTVVALQDAGAPVTKESIGDSIARWLSPGDAQRVVESLGDVKKGPDE